jgi:hypothetical protein
MHRRLALGDHGGTKMDQVESLLKRPTAYGNIDGTGEFGMGFMCLGYALIMWLQLHTPKDSIWNQMYVLFIWVGIMVAMIHFGIKAIKNHITYPRTGFVAYRKQNRIWTAVVASVVSALSVAALALAARSHRDIVMPVFFIGIFFAAGYAFGIARSGGANALFRWKWAVVLAQVIGSLLIALLPEDLTDALSGGASVSAWFSARIAEAVLLYMMLYGTLLLISGTISFWLYLRHTQAPAKEANEPANSDVH